jgi:thiol:disulfide interchange protein
MPKKKRTKKTNNLPRILIVVGLLALVVVVLLLKPDKTPAQTATPQSAVSTSDIPAVQLQNALAQNHPTLAFFHSNNCHQCQVMMETVAQVYPEFNNSITLVDINVYDKRNESLLRQVGLQYIPTLIFYNRAGKEQVSVGVMEAEKLRQTLVALTTGE